MTSIHAPPLASLASRYYRLTASGRACVDMVHTQVQATGSLSPYLKDVLEMCGTGVWFEQLQQFMPPRSLEESLRSLLAQGLIERVEPRDFAACLATAPHRRMAGELMHPTRA